MAKEENRKAIFLIKNLLSGIIWLVGIILVFYFLKRMLGLDFEALIEQYADQPWLVYLIFLASEIIFGIIPPELFMIWAAGSSAIAPYFILMLLLATTSYLAGILGYLIGRSLHKTKFYLLLEKYILKSYVEVLKKYGYYLIIVAALTPIPFSAICMLVGAVEFPFNKFLAFAAFRFLRFTVYAWLILHVSNFWFF